MNHLQTKSGSLQTTQAEKVFLDQVINFQHEVNKILKTLVTPTEETYRYIMAINIHVNREFNQSEVCVMIPSIIEHLSATNEFINNSFDIGGSIDIIDPTVYMCIMESTVIYNYISTVLESFMFSECQPHVRVYINVRDVLKYQATEESIKDAYPEFEIISSPLFFDEFNPEIHYPLSISQLPSDITDYLGNFNKLFEEYLALKGDDKTFFISADESSRQVISILDIISLADIHGYLLTTSSRYAVPYGKYLAEMWFVFNKKIKTIGEYITDIFVAPNCVFVSGIIPFFGLIVKTELEVDCRNIITNEPMKFLFESSTGVEEVTENLTSYLKLDLQNVRTDLFSYAKTVYRVESVNPKFTIEGYNPTVKKKIMNIIIEGSSQLNLLNHLLKSKIYHDLVSQPAGKPSTVPQKYMYYLARRLRLDPEVLVRFGWDASSISFWKRENQNMEYALSLITDLVSFETLDKCGLFNGLDGFTRSNIMLALNKLGVGIDD